MTIKDADEYKEEPIKKDPRTFTKLRGYIRRSDTDLGKFKATDNGPSVVSFHLKDPTKICYAVPRRVAHGRRKWLEEHLEKLQRAGIIEEVTHSNDILHVSPVIIVPKKNNKFRMAVDYRELNKNLKIETMPLPKC